MSGRLRWLLAAALLAMLVIGVVALVDSGPTPEPTTARTVTVTLGGPGHRTVALAPVAQATAAKQRQEDAAGNEQLAHSDLHAEPKQASAPTTLQRDAALKPAGQPPIPARVPFATVNTPGCRTLLVRNFSSRQGSPVLLGVLHFTVSTDSGWAGVLGNVKWFDTPAAQASSNYIIDRRVGACAYTVPETQKAWAQAGFNRVAQSVEVTSRGTEGSLVTGAGRARLIALMVGWHRRWHIPYRHGAVSGCAVTRTGFVMHANLGSCGGGHSDVRPYGIDYLIRAAAAADRPKATVRQVDRQRCRQLLAWRAAGRPKAGEAKAVARRKLLIVRRLNCTRKGPVPK